MLVDVYSDVVCPWCYIGERRLAKALVNRPDLEAEVRWRPFQLQPGMPEGGLPWAEFARRKFGEDGAKTAFARVVAAGKPDGIHFDLDQVASAPNTVDAHRLILLAGDHGVQWRVADALFLAYFTEGRDLNDHEDLVAVASGTGLGAEDVREYLAGKAGVSEVHSSQEEAWQLGITGVPLFVFDGRYALYGAQPVEVFEQALEAALGAGSAGQPREGV
ncbi:MAG TPA: DsbA family oxidoreductase [Rubrobacter sp.]|nr:DsbA family oxidoreductase [Rubrobacter sp.]